VNLKNANLEEKEYKSKSSAAKPVKPEKRCNGILRPSIFFSKTELATTA
jgi:hypothetical protein